MAKSLRPADTSMSTKPGRPRKLTYKRVLDAALQVMDDEGYGSLTMRSLAAALGVTHPTLYNYIGHIEDIEAEVLNTLSGNLPRPKSTKAVELRKELLEYLLVARQLLFKHPNARFPAMGSAPWKTFLGVSLDWIAALEPFAEDRTGAMTAHSALIAYVSSDAEHERIYGSDYAEKLRKHMSRHAPGLVDTAMAESGALGRMVDSLLPGLRQPASVGK